MCARANVRVMAARGARPIRPQSTPQPLPFGQIVYRYVEFYRRMVRDLDREINWQREHPNELAGNVLCALLLVVYTEVLGRLAVEQLEHRRARNPEAFRAFLRRMSGGAYADWCTAWEKRHRKKIYDVLRNGLVHEYVPKIGAKLWFFFESDENFGFGEEADYPLVLKIRPYFDDFRAAGEQLFGQLLVESQAAAHGGRARRRSKP